VRVHSLGFAANPRRLEPYLAEKGLAPDEVRVDLTPRAQRSDLLLANNPDCGMSVLDLDECSPAPPEHRLRDVGDAHGPGASPSYFRETDPC
jgi:hypothetical protein